MNKKGFGTLTKIANYQTFSCECLYYDPKLDEEELVELWSIKIDKNRFRSAADRKAIALAVIYCFLETEEAKKRGINRIFVWNNKTREYEPLGVVSDNPLEGSELIQVENVNPDKAFKKLLNLVKLEVVKCNFQI